MTPGIQHDKTRTQGGINHQTSDSGIKEVNSGTNKPETTFQRGLQLHQDPFKEGVMDITPGIQPDETTTQGGIYQQTSDSGMKEVSSGTNDPVLTSQNGLHLPEEVEVTDGIQNTEITSQNGLHLPKEVEVTPGIHHIILVTAPNIKIVQTSTSSEILDPRVTEKTSRKTTRRWIRWTVM